MNLTIKINNIEVTGVFTISGTPEDLVCEVVTHKYFDNIKLIENDRYRCTVNNVLGMEFSSVDMMVKQVLSIDEIDIKEQLYKDEILIELEKEYFKDEFISLNDIEELLGGCERSWTKMN